MQTNEAMSPSELVCKAAKLTPKGLARAPVGGRCAMCGASHVAGEEIVPFEPLATFTDWQALRAPQSRVICRWCHGVWTRDFTQTHLKSIVCADGVFPAASNDHLAYWLLNPPDGPWVFLQGDQKVQHVVWRAPVNLSREVYQIRAGESILTVRRESLQAGAMAAKELADKATELRGAKRGAPYKSPFVSLSRDRDSPSQGALRPELLRHASSDPLTAKNIATIHSLTAGELWALTSVLYAINPNRPEPKFNQEDVAP